MQSLVVLALLVLAGSADVEGQSAEVARLYSERAACVSLAGSAPPIVALRHRFTGGTADRGPNDVKATPIEAELMLEMALTYMKRCREIDLAIASLAHPSVRALYLAWAEQADTNIEMLVSHQITWAEYIRTADRIRNKFDADLARIKVRLNLPWLQL